MVSTLAEPTTRMDEEEAIDARRRDDLVKERLVGGIVVVVGWICRWFDVAVITSIIINNNSQIIIINLLLSSLYFVPGSSFTERAAAPICPWDDEPCRCYLRIDATEPIGRHDQPPP